MHRQALAGTRAASTACGACGHPRIRHQHRPPYACAGTEWLVDWRTSDGTPVYRAVACPCRHYVDTERS